MLTNLTFSGPNAALCYIYVFSVFVRTKRLALSRVRLSKITYPSEFMTSLSKTIGVLHDCNFKQLLVPV